MSFSKPVKLSAESIKNGTLLDEVAMHNASMFEASMLNSTADPPDELTWGSICSGGEVIEIILLAITNSYKAVGKRVRLNHKFSCEDKTGIQEWILGLQQELGTAMNGCLFEKAEGMGEVTQWCIKHDNNCVIPQVDIMIAGTSCKDFSRANIRSGSSSKSTLLMEHSVGGSAQTFHGLIKYLVNHVVSILMLENVDTIDDNSSATDQSSLDIMMETFAKVCLTCLKLLTDAHFFGLPQERRRYYLVGLRSHSAPHFTITPSNINEIFKKISGLVAMCERTPPCVTQILLDGDDDAVDRELNKRLAIGHKSSNYNVSQATSDYKRLGIRWGDAGSRLPVEVKCSTWFQTLAPSQVSALTFSHAEMDVAVMRDISQSLSRLRYSKMVDSDYDDKRHVAFCQMPQQIAWLECANQQPRPLLGREALMIQGYPIAQIPNLVNKSSENVMASIAGNMMASTTALCIVQATLYAMPWNNSKAIHSTKDEVEAALQIFDTIAAPATEESQERSKKVRRVKITKRQA